MEKKTIKISDSVSVRELAQKLDVSPALIISTSLKLGSPVTINEEIDWKTAEIIALELGFEVEKEEAEKKYSPLSVKEIILKEKPENLKPRPPIVAVMGHVDHGKTSLLDAILKTNIVAKEKGGITQHIGAFEVEKKARKITFIDTPGHEAFVAIRARGAQVTDIAVLVVAADDGVRPQTKEAINHCRRAEVPIIVAISKIDKKEADINKVKEQLAENDLVCEDWGGKTICIPTSAVTKKGIDDLLEMILLVADIEGFSANPQSQAIGTVIESHKDAQKGNLATVIIQNGTLKEGEFVVCGKSFGRVRFMENFLGEKIKEALPSSPARIYGLSEIPYVGDIFWTVPDEKTASKIAKEAEISEKIKKTKEISEIKPSEILEGEEEKIKFFKILLKADVLGSLEALQESISLMGTEEVKPAIIKQGVGDITESDIMIAHTTNAEILAFNVKIDSAGQLALKRHPVSVKTFQVIYDLIDYVHKKLEECLEPEIIETSIGKIKILKIFKSKGKNFVIGCKVKNGKVEKGTKAKIFRGEDFLGEGKILNLKRFTEEVKEVGIGKECGIEIESEIPLEIDDLLEIIKKEERKRRL